MAYDELLAKRIRKRLTKRKGVTEKEMFGGVGFLLNGNMCVGVWKQSLIVRIDKEEGEEALREPHVKPFDITGRAMKGWLLIEPAGAAADEHLNDWLQRAVDFVAALRAK